MVIYYLMPVVFTIGILAIALEDVIRVDKAATAVGMCIVLWLLFLLDAVFIYTAHPPELLGDFFKSFPDFASLPVRAQAYKYIGFRITDSLGDVSTTLFFVLASMVIIEVMSSFGGFTLLTGIIRTRAKRKLLWVISFLTFFLSPLVGNLAAMIVMVAIARILIPRRKERLLYSCIIIVSANAGGSWSPIGDVTTLLLWTGGNLTVFHQIVHVFPAAAVMMLIPLIATTFAIPSASSAASVSAGSLASSSSPASSFSSISAVSPDSSHAPAFPAVVTDNSLALSGPVRSAEQERSDAVYRKISPRLRTAVLVVGLASLLLVPVWQILFRLPPFMGVLLGLVILWVITDRKYAGNIDSDLQYVRVGRAFSRVDVSTIFFFLGILMSVQALNAAGQLSEMAGFLNKTLKDPSLISFILGICSSFLDNVALVSASMGMYPVAPAGAFMADGTFWTFLAYCAVTGGSILIIGSASGVTVMGMEKISFGYYLKRFTLWVLLGYAAGAGVFLLFI